MQPGDHHSSTQKTMGFLSEEIKPASTGLNSCTEVRIEELIESLHSEGDLGLISEWGRSPGVGNGNPLQYSYLENPMNRGAWGAHSPCGLKAMTKLSDWVHTSMLVFWKVRTPPLYFQSAPRPLMVSVVHNKQKTGESFLWETEWPQGKELQILILLGISHQKRWLTTQSLHTKAHSFRESMYIYTCMLNRVQLFAIP